MRLGRSPDAPGLADWQHNLDSGMSLATVHSDFAYSDEAISDITNLYQQDLGRAPEAGILPFWFDHAAGRDECEFTINERQSRLMLGRPACESRPPIRACIPEPGEIEGGSNGVYLWPC